MTALSSNPRLIWVCTVRRVSRRRASREFYRVLAGNRCWLSGDKRRLLIVPAEIACMMGPWQAVALMALSLSLMHIIVYLAGFAGQEEQGHPVTAFFHFSLAGYGLVLLTCAFIFWVFGALDGHSLAVTVDALSVLAFPGAIGFCFCTSADLMTKTAPKTSASKPSAKPDSSTDTPWLAWMMGGLGLTLVVACLSIILWCVRHKANGSLRSKLIRPAAKRLPTLRLKVPSATKVRRL